MSAATKRKYVAQEFLDELVLPDESKSQEIVQVTGPRGNNLHEVENANGDKFLASMPPKFRKNIWIKRGDFVLIEPITEGDKVKGEIIHIVRTKDQIRYLQQEGKWPKRFLKTGSEQRSKSGTDSDSDSDDDVPRNLNRVNGGGDPSSDSDSDESDTSEDDYVPVAPNPNRIVKVKDSTDDESSSRSDSTESDSDTDTRDDSEKAHSSDSDKS